MEAVTRKISLFIALGALPWLVGCSSTPDACKRGEAITKVEPLDATRVAVTFACELDGGSAKDPANFAIADFTAEPAAMVAVGGASVDGQRVTLTTAAQTGGVRYTLRVDGVRDAAGNTLVDSANFIGAGAAGGAPITFKVDDRYNANLTEVWLLLSVDAATGRFSHKPQRVLVDDPDGDHQFQITVPVAVDPLRTADTEDDKRGPEYIAYTVRAVDKENRPLSHLVVFEVADDSPQTLDIRLLSVPGKPCPEGLVDVAITIDDRPARALRQPKLKASFDAQGQFDATFPTELAVTDDDGDGLWQATAKVRIQCAEDGAFDEEIQPYSVFLVEGDTPHEGRTADFLVTDAKPQSVAILMGNDTLVPVTFSVDTAQAWLDVAGASRGLYPGEAVFLTGEFGGAEDAFGRNASDAFSGGENVVLQMREREDKKGVWVRTIFMRKNRPAGWKVIRCPKDQGCSQLNTLVTSSGRAFPTVMKNLVTELCDAGKTSWPDSNCSSPKVIDPRNLGAVDTGAGTLSYSAAKIYAGSGSGGLEQDQPGTPNAALMFKQEAPDLVVDVKASPITTPVYVVGTWRDVNIPGAPADIVAAGTPVNLNETDYDAGMIGGLPPSYKASTPPPPPPPPPPPTGFVMDGKLDSAAKQIAGGGGTMRVWAAIAKDVLYLATDDSGEGSDNFILLSATAPAAARPAPWGKAGTVAFGGKTLFVADENDGAFAGWFELGDPDVLVAQAGAPAGGLAVATGANGGVVEGTVDLKIVFGQVPALVYLAVAPWGNDDAGPIYAPAQTPATTDQNGNIEATEILKLELPALKVQP